MVWYEIKNRFEHDCAECKKKVPVGTMCWWLKDEQIIVHTECIDKFVGPITQGNPESFSGATYNQNDKNEAIAKAHQENMEANRELVMSIRLLTTAVNDRSALLKKSMEAKA